MSKHSCLLGDRAGFLIEFVDAGFHLCMATRHQFWQVCLLTARQCGLALDQINPDAHFVDDIRLD